MFQQQALFCIIKSVFVQQLRQFFVLPEPKMEAERGSAVKTAYGMVTAIL